MPLCLGVRTVSSQFISGSTKGQSCGFLIWTVGIFAAGSKISKNNTAMACITRGMHSVAIRLPRLDPLAIRLSTLSENFWRPENSPFHLSLTFSWFKPRLIASTKSSLSSDIFKFGKVGVYYSPSSPLPRIGFRVSFPQKKQMTNSCSPKGTVHNKETKQKKKKTPDG